jgi:hypothetical protein
MNVRNAQKILSGCKGKTGRFLRRLIRNTVGLRDGRFASRLEPLAAHHRYVKAAATSHLATPEEEEGEEEKSRMSQTRLVRQHP